MTETWMILVIGIWVAALLVGWAIAIMSSKSRKARVALVVMFIIAGLSTLAIFPTDQVYRAKYQGTPLPTSWEDLQKNAAGGEIHGFYYTYGEAVWMMVVLNGEVRTYELPWDESKTQDVQNARRSAEEQGTVAVIRGEGEGNGEGNGEGDGQGQGEGQGQGNGEGGEQGNGGAGDPSQEDRPPPFAYPRPQPPRPPKYTGQSGPSRGR